MSQSQDPAVALQEQTENLTPQEKIDGLKRILKSTSFGMMTTRATDGNLHSRCMGLASFDALHFSFIANKASHKFEELDKDPHVNVSFLDPSTSNWISVVGQATISQDKDKIAKLWSTSIRAWFGNLGDGVHKGNQNDPRVAVIEVVPTEIRYYTATKGKISQAFDIATSAVTGDVATPGELRTITRDEIRVVEGLNTA